MSTQNHTLGVAGRIARAFVNARITPLLVVVALLLGVFAVVKLPREEEPQISVPMFDIFVPFPGAGAKEVEQRVTRPMEKLLWEIPGVEYIYSTSSPGMSVMPGGGGYCPIRCITSGLFTPAAATFIKSSPGAADGVGRSVPTSTSGGPGFEISTAFMASPTTAEADRGPGICREVR